MNYSIPKVKRTFLSLLHFISPDDVAKSPGKDFSRKRKCSLFDTLLLLLTMAGHSLTTELDNYFLAQKKDVPSSSAFIQQRSKLSAEALPIIFSRFNQLFPFEKTFKGLHLLACDGSDLNIPSLSGDLDTFIPYNSKNGGYFQMHLNAVFDLLEKRYVDAVLCPRRKMGENRSLCTMIDRSTMPGRILYIADRGYNCYNTIAHIINAGQFYLIRSKNISGNRSLLNGASIPVTDEFDIDYTFSLTRKSVPKKNNTANLKHLNKNRVFDFIDPDDKNSVFTFKMRIVKIRIGEDSYEYLLTNLPRKMFTLNTLKDLYGRRWGIETSFRQLKYALSLIYFHSQKRDFIKQEVFARLIMFNFISLTIAQIPIRHDEGLKYVYHISFSDSVEICRKSLLNQLSIPKLKALLLQRLSPIRPERSSPRNLRSQRLRPLNNRA